MTTSISDKPRELAIDIETYSSVDIKNGAYAYAEAPDFEILLIAYKFSDQNEVQVLDCTVLDEFKRTGRCRDGWSDIRAQEFYEALMDETVIKTAYNANFERTCLAKACNAPMPPEQWRCTQILAVQLGLPRALADVGPALGLPEDQQKLKTGKALIQYFCKPCKATKANGKRTRNLPEHAPEKWNLFVEYNKQDVVTEQAILDRLRAYRPTPAEEALWDVDQRINDRGVRLDVPMAEKIVRYDAKHGEELMAEAQALTGLSNPNSLMQLRPWLHAQGIETDSLTKTVVAELLASDLPDNVRRVLEIRQQLSRTSVKKYQTMLDIASPRDNRARGIMQFYGGHTGRWAGRSLQPQNLSRNTMPDADLDTAHDLAQHGDFDIIDMLYGDTSEVFSQLVRTAFIPSEGCRFVVSDFSAIEARVIAWLAGEKWRLDVFRQNGDIYCESASHIYHVPVVKHGINGELRQRGKVAELALGYGGGVGAMKSMDTTGSVPEEEMQGIVTQWRSESPRIVQFWKGLERACVACIRGQGAKQIPIKEFDPDRARENEARTGASEGSYSDYFNCGAAPIKMHLRMVAGTPVLRIWLPSGRPISFWDPKVEDTDLGPRVTYMSQNQVTRKWERVETYGGKLTENVVQSVARDCLADKMMTLERMGYKVVFHVHDEMIIDAPRSDEHAAEIVDQVMGAPISWAPGLPLKGGTYECNFYRKD